MRNTKTVYSFNKRDNHVRVPLRRFMKLMRRKRQEYQRQEPKAN